MTAKEYLSGAKRLDDIINCCLRELEYWRSLSRSVSGSNFEEHLNPDRPTEAPFARCLDKIDEIERDINGKVDALVDLRTEINKAIDAVGNFEEQIVLRCRYLDNLTWEAIGGIIGVSVRTVHRIHGTALQHFPIPE